MISVVNRFAFCFKQGMWRIYKYDVNHERILNPKKAHKSWAFLGFIHNVLGVYPKWHEFRSNFRFIFSLALLKLPSIANY